MKPSAGVTEVDVDAPPDGPDVKGSESDDRQHYSQIRRDSFRRRRLSLRCQQPEVVSGSGSLYISTASVRKRFGHGTAGAFILVPIPGPIMARFGSNMIHWRYLLPTL